jgi:glycosyltransferase involved in cell wall biosynthesis
VIAGVSTAHRFAALTAGHADAIAEIVHVGRERITAVGAGFRDDVFTGAGAGRRGHVAYAGKLSDAKGLPQLLDAVDGLDGVTLHVAGGGAGPEAEALAARIDSSPRVAGHGRLDQTELAALLGSVDVFALPSLFEGLPQVLVEAYASGCRLVATDLPGTRELARVLGDAIELVPRPETDGPDRPIAAAIPGFVADLAGAIRRAVAAGPITPDPEILGQLTWDAVYERIEAIWRELAC